MDYSIHWPGAEVVTPHASWRGTYLTGTWTDGQVQRCRMVRGLDHDPNSGPPVNVDGEGTGTLVTDKENCIKVPWPDADRWMSGQVRANNVLGPDTWMGSLITDKRDASGQVFMRNRYYDPESGRFTQEDPIGLAGGLNVYGFANGDPVSYSDPYGLCPIPLSSCLGREGADLGAGFVPVVSTIHDGATVLTGRNYVTDDKVGAGGRFVAFVGMVSPASGGQIRAAGNVIQAAARELSQQIGKNSVSIGTVNGVRRVDLVGKAHGGVETPHVHTYSRHTNPQTGQTSISRDSKEVTPATMQDIRQARRVARDQNQ